MGGKKDTGQTFQQVEKDLLKQLYTNARTLLEAGTDSLLLRFQVDPLAHPFPGKTNS